MRIGIIIVRKNFIDDDRQKYEDEEVEESKIMQ